MHCSSCGEIISPDEGTIDDLCEDCFQMINGGAVEDSYFLDEDEEESSIL